MKILIIILVALLFAGCGASMYDVNLAIAKHEVREMQNDSESHKILVGWIKQVEKKADNCGNEWIFQRLQKYMKQLEDSSITVRDLQMLIRDLERLDKMKKIAREYQ